MVSGVQSTGTNAYVRGSQLGSSSSGSANFKKEVAGTESPSAADTLKKAEKPEDTTKNEDRPPQQSQLEARNDNETLQTEQARGSLLDIAV